MKKNLMAVLTASSVAVMAAGATLAAYAEPEQEELIKDENETYVYSVASKCLYINKPDGFVNWKAEDAGIKPNEIVTVSFAEFSGEKIPDNAFKGCTSIENIVFPERGSLTEIGTSAFEGCTSISQLDFGDTTIEKIGESAFKGCTSISKLVFYSDAYTPAHTEYKSPVTEIGKSAFQDCTGLMDIVFGNALEEIGESAFEGCINLGKTEEKPSGETNNTDTIIWIHRVRFESTSSNLETIGKRAFYGCEKLTDFGFPENVKTIGEYAFANCLSLYGANMIKCDRLKSIEKYAFFNCVSLMEVHFPHSGEYNSGYNTSIPKHTIAEGAFRNCSWLEGVILSPYVGNVAPGAFYKCKNLKYIGYYVNELRNIGTNIKIEIDTEHSTQDPPNPPQNAESTAEEQSVRLLAASGEDSETVTIYVPPEVTAFSYGQMNTNEKYAVLDQKTAEMFRKKLEDSGLELTYGGQIITKRDPNNPPFTEPREPREPGREDGSYYSTYEYRNISFENYQTGIIDEELFAQAKDVWKSDHSLWQKNHDQWEKDYEQWVQDKNAYQKWDEFVKSDSEIETLWKEVLASEECEVLDKKYPYRESFYVTLYNEPTSKEEALSGVALYSRQRSKASKLPIVLPEKFYTDADIYSITRVDGTIVFVDIPIGGKIRNNGDTFYYYNFSKMENMGYEFIANYLLDSGSRTYRSRDDYYDPKASGIYGTSTGEKYVLNFPVITTIGSLDDLNAPPPPGSSSSTTTTSPNSTPPPTSSTSNPPSPPPPTNTYDPIEPDPDPSEPESSEPESSEPESSEPESSKPESSKPESSEPENNPPTGTRFLAPIVLVGAAVAVVAARRRKMK